MGFFVEFIPGRRRGGEGGVEEDVDVGVEVEVRELEGSLEGDGEGRPGVVGAGD